MATLVRSIKLFFQEGTSDKVYHAHLYDEGGGTFTVEVEWGRRGASLNKGKKAVSVPREKAEKAFASLVREKRNKGYEEMTAEVKPAAEAPPEGQGSGSRATGVRKRIGIAAQLLNAIEEAQALALLADEHHVAQQKLDGNRVIVHVGEKVFGTNRAGQVTTLHHDIIEGASYLPRGTVLDGEVVTTTDGPTYFLFDVLSIGSSDVRQEGYLARWSRLMDDLEPGLSGPIRVLECAHTAKEKHSLFERLRASKAEGIVFKHKHAPYTSGRPASGGTQLKHKFVKAADVVLVENAGNAYRMVVRDGKKWRDVGKVFAGTTNASRKEIDSRIAAGERLVAEVKYLYATDDDQLFQPVFVRLRDDKEEEACILGQLHRTNRAVHAVD
jgi:bifunctional non-homologous end joining protein LigD